MEREPGRTVPRRFEDGGLVPLSDDDEPMRSAVLGRRGRELRDALVELEAADVEVVVSRRTRLARRIGVRCEVRDVDDRRAKVRSDHAPKEVARRDRDVQRVEGLEPGGQVPPELRRLPGDRETGQARRLLAEPLIELEQVVPRAADPVVVGRVHLQRGAWDVDQVESEQGQVVVVDDVRSDFVDELVVMPPDAGRRAEDPRAQRLEAPRRRFDRMADHTTVSGVVEVGPSAFEGQGGGRVFDVDLVALRGQGFRQIADMVRVPAEMVRWIERGGHDELEGLHSARPSAPQILVGGASIELPLGENGDPAPILVHCLKKPRSVQPE